MLGDLRRGPLSVHDCDDTGRCAEWCAACRIDAELASRVEPVREAFEECREQYESEVIGRNPIPTQSPPNATSAEEWHEKAARFMDARARDYAEKEKGLPEGSHARLVIEAQWGEAFAAAQAFRSMKSEVPGAPRAPCSRRVGEGLSSPTEGGLPPSTGTNPAEERRKS